MSAQSHDYTEGLNARQKEAVLQTEGPVLVLAGAGSGKTRVIARRIAHILGQGLAGPPEILAVTFTNKAAEEMRERVAGLVGTARASATVISTFHSFCLRVLRGHIEKVGYRKNFSIAGEGDSRTLLRRVVDEIGEAAGFSPALFQSAISLCKNEDILPNPDRPKPVRNETEEKYERHMAPVYEAYQSALRAANSVDFDDLLLLTLKLWREHPAVLHRFRNHFRYVMVDEYQDTNQVQYQLLRMLAEEHENLCVVGDDDQSIYSWRGANVRNILEFERDFPKARIVTLDQNYRSTTTILEAAHHVIQNNTQRRDKKLWSDLGQGRALDWFVVRDDEAEAVEAARWLKRIQERTGARYRDFALLYRSNAQSRPLEIAFRQAGIPYVVYGGQEFFERTEVKDIIAYLKVIVNPRDESSLLRVINMPRRGIGDTTLHKAHDICREERISLGEALNEIIKRGLATPPAERGIREFLGLIARYRKRFREGGVPLQSLVEDLVRDIGYNDELERVCKTREQAFNRWQNVELVVRAVADYEREAQGPSLLGFLDESHLSGDQDRATKRERGDAAVTLMTIHSAKGLEFPFVFIMGLEDGLLPHERSLKENSLEEERRLFYVAITRGQRHVTFFEAVSRTLHGRERMSKTSRFLSEIPEKLVQRHVGAVREMVEEHVAPPKPRPKGRKRSKK